MWQRCPACTQIVRRAQTVDQPVRRAGDQFVDPDGTAHGGSCPARGRRPAFRYARTLRRWLAHVEGGGLSIEELTAIGQRVGLAPEVAVLGKTGFEATLAFMLRERLRRLPIGPKALARTWRTGAPPH